MRAISARCHMRRLRREPAVTSKSRSRSAKRTLSRHRNVWAGLPSRTEGLVGFVEAIPALLRLGRGPSKPINHLPQCLCAAAAPFACGAIQLKLRVCTRSACEDVARSANFMDTIEGLGIFAEQREEVIEHRLDRLCGVAFTFTHDKTRGSAVTMGAPYVLLGNGAVDHVNIGVEDRIMV